MAVVTQMVHDLKVDLQIRVVPTVRDPDGLALSSRNARLSPEERARALAIPRALGAGIAAARDGRDPVEAARALLGGLDVDYVAVADFNGHPTLAIAARAGRTRLIDNVRLDDSADAPARTGRHAGAHRMAGDQPPKPRITPFHFGRAKERGDLIAMVTAYDAPSARLAEAAGVDGILVGDSAAMTVLGHDSTVQITVDEMLVLTRAVSRSVYKPLVVADMPFGSFQVSDEEAVRHAVRLVKEGGAGAVKLEGAGPTLTRVKAIVGVGIPVMGHVGLTPQSAVALGGYRVQGRRVRDAQRLLDEARALQDAGCFAVVLEAMPAVVAARITEALEVPTIGIGAGPCVRRTDSRLARSPRPHHRPRAAVRQAIRRSRHDGQGRARGLRDRRPLADIPRAAAHLRHGRGRGEIFERDLKEGAGLQTDRPEAQGSRLRKSIEVQPCELGSEELFPEP